MRFKLSAKELDILDKDRVKILTQLRDSQLASASPDRGPSEGIGDEADPSRARISGQPAAASSFPGSKPGGNEGQSSFNYQGSWKRRSIRQPQPKKPMKPPILVVPLDNSRLVCIVQRCDDFDDLKTTTGSSSAAEKLQKPQQQRHRKRKRRRRTVETTKSNARQMPDTEIPHQRYTRCQNHAKSTSATPQPLPGSNLEPRFTQPEHRCIGRYVGNPDHIDNLGSSSLSPSLDSMLNEDCISYEVLDEVTKTGAQKVRRHLGRLLGVFNVCLRSFRKMVHRHSRAGKTEQRAKMHQQRIAEELALGAIAGAVGPLISDRSRTRDPNNGAGPADEDGREKAELMAARAAQMKSPFYQELEPSLSLKCDVCVLSTFKHVFLFIDVLLQTRLWSEESGS